MRRGRISSETVWLTVCIALVGGGAVARLLLAFLAPLFRDETQCLWASWNVSRGFIPYRDFWENHTPLTFYVLAPLFRLLPDGRIPIFTARVLAFAISGVLFWIAFLTARRCFGKLVAWTSIALLSCDAAFMLTMSEIRPDHLLNLFCMSAFIVLLRNEPSTADDSRRFRPTFWSGVLFGMGAISSPKALFAVTAAAVAVTAIELPSFLRLSNRTLATKKVLRALAALSSGFAIPVLALCAVLYRVGALPMFLYWMGPFNFRESAAHRVYLVSPSLALPPTNLSFVVWILGAVGIAEMLRDRIKERTHPNNPRVLFVGYALVLTVLTHFAMPRPWRQTLCMAFPYLAICGATHLVRWGESSFGKGARRLRRNFARLGLVIGAFALAYVGQATWKMAQSYVGAPLKLQLSTIDAVLESTAPSQTVEVGSLGFAFRPPANYFGALHGIWDSRYLDGKHGFPSIREMFPKRGTRLVFLHPKIVSIKDNFEFIHQNYLPSSIADNCYVAGKELTADSFHDRVQAFQLDIPGTYIVAGVGEALSLWIDGRLVGAEISLEPGLHTLRYEGTLRSVRLTAKLK